MAFLFGLVLGSFITWMILKDKISWDCIVIHTESLSDSEREELANAISDFLNGEEESDE